VTVIYTVCPPLTEAMVCASGAEMVSDSHLGEVVDCESGSVTHMGLEGKLLGPIAVRKFSHVVGISRDIEN
jgi:hypothetical protein